VIQPLDIQTLHPQPQRFQQLPVKKRQRRLGLMQSQIFRYTKSFTFSHSVGDPGPGLAGRDASDASLTPTRPAGF
jgi:hypothetical protein